MGRREACVVRPGGIDAPDALAAAVAFRQAAKESHQDHFEEGKQCSCQNVTRNF